jgi:hypothetical protein
MLIRGLYGWPIQGEKRERISLIYGMPAYELMKILAIDDKGCIIGHKTSNSSSQYTVCVCVENIESFII